MSTASLRTKDGILEAARIEFAAHGLAGGRVDRIAKAAGANVQRIYAYYGDKQGLFDAVVASAVHDLAGQMDPHARGIADVAGALFDFVVGHPENSRTMTWARLEREEEFVRITGSDQGGTSPISLVARLQRAGLVDPQPDARVIVEALIAICERCESTLPADAVSTIEERRDLVLRFARTLAING